MNGGYFMIDCSGLNVNSGDEQTVIDIFDNITEGLKTEKPIIFVGCVNGTDPVSPFEVKLMASDTGYFGNSGVLYFSIDQYNQVTVSSAITPADTGEHYSTTEQQIGTWLNNAPLYQIVIDAGTLPNTTTKLIDPPANIDLIVEYGGFIYYPEDHSYQRPLPLASGGNSTVRIDYQENKLRITTYEDWTEYDAYIILKYTKTT